MKIQMLIVDANFLLSPENEENVRKRFYTNIDCQACRQQNLSQITSLINIIENISLTHIVPNGAERREIEFPAVRLERHV